MDLANVDEDLCRHTQYPEAWKTAAIAMGLVCFGCITEGDDMVKSCLLKAQDGV